MIWSLSTLLFIVIFIDLLLVILFIFNFKEYTSIENSPLPKVSILIAAKDEEANVARCLNSLLKLSYPLDKMEILIGNDASEDKTLMLLRQYEKKYVHIKVFDIIDQVGEQQGKPNVLAQLADQTTGDFFLITDADMSLPEHWIENMLSTMGEKVGLAIGVTSVKSSRMQDLDWLFALGMIKVVTDLGLPVTGMGNNIIISKEAYRAVGGYEKLPFSTTEDFELFKHIKAKGYQCVHIFQKEVLGITLPVKTFFDLLNQRKRWMKGAIQLPWHIVVLLFMQSSFYFCLLILYFITPFIAIILLVSKVTIQLIFITFIRTKLQLPLRFGSILLYELYSICIVFSSILYFLMPFKVTWKGREY